MQLKTCVLRWVLALSVVLISGSVRAASPAVERAKSATALVELPGDEGFGSAFCIDGSGLFVTNAHVVEDLMPGEQPNLVINAGQTNQKVLRASVLRSDAVKDLALLQVSTDEPLISLPLGSLDDISETLPIVALGFPFGTDLALDNGQYPAVTVSVGRISALRRSQGQLREIQVDAAINPGNSGGPLINEQGQVIGIVYAGIEGAAGLNFAIAVTQLQQLLATPQIVFTAPLIPFAEREKERPWTFKIISFNAAPAAAPADYRVDFALDDGSGERHFEARATQGQYAVQAAPRVVGNARGGLVRYRITVTQGAKTVAQSSGAIRIAAAPRAAPVANDDWLAGGAAGGDQGATGAAAAPTTKIGQLSVENSGKKLLQDPRVVVDAQVSTVDLNARNLAANLLWSSDGNRLFALEKSGVLHVIAVPSFEEEKIVNLGQSAAFLGLSREGIVVGLPELQELWLLDGANFSLRKRVAVAKMGNLAASPALSTVYLAQGDNLTVVDWKTGQVARQLNAREMQREAGDELKKHPRSAPLLDFKRIAVTPDGRYLLCESLECLHRLRIEGDDLVYEEAGPAIGQNSQRLEISADSNYVALPSGGGNYAWGNGGDDGDNPVRRTPYTTYIYRVTDLVHPITEIQSGAYPQALGFDRAAAKIYAQNSGTPLIVFTPQGIAEKSYPLRAVPHPKSANPAAPARNRGSFSGGFGGGGFGGGLGDEPAFGGGGFGGTAFVGRGPQSGVRQLLAHPSGSKVLVWADSLFWVELPNNR